MRITHSVAFIYLFFSVFIFLVTLPAIAIIGVETQILSRFAPLSGNDFLFVAGFSSIIVIYFTIRMGNPLRECFLALIILPPVIGALVLGFASLLHRFFPIFDLWPATLLVMGTSFALAFGFAYRIIEAPLFLDDDFEEEDEDVWEDEDYYVPPKRVSYSSDIPSPVFYKSKTEREDVWKNVKRNNPCPCGSGKKYKNCHGQSKSRR